MTSSTPNMGDISPIHQMASSCAGAFLVSLFMTPLDVVKIRLQSQEQIWSKKCFLYSNGLMDHLCPRLNGDPRIFNKDVVNHTKEEICNCKWYNRPKYFNGTLDAFLKISRTEGVTSLWSGLSPTLVLAIPTTVIYFTTYEQLKSKLFKFPIISEKKEVGMALSGGLARIWAVTVVSPLELIRTKMQSKKMPFSEVVNVLKYAVRNEGVRSLWLGYSATLLRDVPFSALYWPLYEGTKSLLKPQRSDITLIDTFLAGAIAGSIASTATLPMDVIKTHKQLEIGQNTIENGRPHLKTSNLTVIREILKSQGPKGLFAGLTPRILKVAPACAIMISSYEYCKTYFQNRTIKET